VNVNLAGNALHAGADRQHVLGADGAARVAQPLEWVARKQRLRRGNGSCEFEPVEFGRRSHPDARLIHPFTRPERRRRLENLSADRSILYRPPLHYRHTMPTSQHKNTEAKRRLQCHLSANVRKRTTF